MNLTGYVRQDGRVGIRNHVLIMPVSYEMNQIAHQISAQVPGTTTFQNGHGIEQEGQDLLQTVRVLTGFATHPNVFGVVILAWGNETFDASTIAAAALASGKKVEMLCLLSSGGMRKTIQKGSEIAQSLMKESALVQREPIRLDQIILGTECGGSDACSGISGNPTLGVVSDFLVEKGGTSILAETTELIGAEHLLAKRALTNEVAQRILFIVKRIEENAMRMGADIRGTQPSPGNMEGGITTIEEKSLGCIYKGGTTPIKEVVEYAMCPNQHGLVIMDTPGQDIEQATGMVAGGAQLIIFTTGRGTPTGSPIAPVIKVATNQFVYEKMHVNIDFNAGTIVEGKETVQKAGEHLFQNMLAVINGRLTASERLGHREFGIYRIGSLTHAKA